MEKDSNCKKGRSLIKRIKDYFKSQEYADAQFLDYMEAHPELPSGLPPVETPPDEFDKIMAEMQKRGIKPRARRQLRFQALCRQMKGLTRRPAAVAAMALLIVMVSAVGVSAKKAYNIRIRERDAGSSNIVLNNDQGIITAEDSVDKAYKSIESELEIKPIKMYFMPPEMKLQKLKIKEGKGIMQFIYDGRTFDLVQINALIANSKSMVSDREVYKNINNELLETSIAIEKNSLTDGNIEFSAGFGIRDTYYYLSGIIDEDIFIEIIENLNY